jgi:hypothetical protein
MVLAGWPCNAELGMPGGTNIRGTIEGSRQSEVQIKHVEIVLFLAGKILMPADFSGIICWPVLTPFRHPTRLPLKRTQTLR